MVFITLTFVTAFITLQKISNCATFIICIEITKKISNCSTFIICIEITKKISNFRKEKITMKLSLSQVKRKKMIFVTNQILIQN